MNAFNSASLINLLGFSLGVTLYALLLVMVVRHRKAKKKSSIDYLLLATAILGLLWNVGELSIFIWKDFGISSVSPVLTAISYAAVGFLPTVVVHSAWQGAENLKGRIFTVSAYALSSFAAFLHFRAALFFDDAPSSLALQILTFGSLTLLAGLLIFNFRQTLEKKTLWATALLIFAVSTLHLNSRVEENSWLIELIAHQSSLPLALVILYQDYRFAFADLFLKRALSLILLTLTAFGLYVFVASPLLHFHETHDRNDVQAISLIIILWIATALIYPALHKLAAWLVDKVLLNRVNYEELSLEIAQGIEKKELTDDVLNEVCNKLSPALTANTVSWSEVYENENEMNLPSVNFTPHRAEVFIPTTESPFYRVNLKDFAGGRHLLSDEIEMLEAVSLVTARRIDALRVTHERCDRELREQEFSKLATEAQLTALRAQINPHFLFNALTTIGYLIQTTPEKAFDTLMRLTQLLRGVLSSTSEFSTLGDELKLIESYLDIEKARFEERLEVKFSVSPELYHLKIPSLILQPLVENAVKHGISNKKEGGEIKIEARIKGQNLILQVCDTGAGVNQAKLLASYRKGVGLNNVEQRLNSYFGSSARFEVESKDEKGTKARITIPLALSKAISAEVRTSNER